MATDGPTPPPCNPDIFARGAPVCAIDGRSNAVERWVQAVARDADALVDWHYSGGIASVLHLGDDVSRARVEDAVTRLEPTLDGRILRRYAVGEADIYRRGVTEAPESAIATFMDPLTGDAAFIVGGDGDKP